MFKKISIAFAAVLGLMVAWILSVVVPVSGKFQALDPKLVERCMKVPVHAGTEDVVIDRATGVAFVSATDRRRTVRDNANDGIYAFALSDPSAVIRVSPNNMPDFHPHGISLWQDAGETRLFAISHTAAGAHSVEIFSVGVAGALEHLESISFDAMYLPNDVVAVGPRSFYASNSRGYKSGVLSVLEQFFALPWASAVYFDGREGRLIKDRLVYANGINLSPDGGILYIAEVLKRRISAFDRNAETGALTGRSTIDLNTAPDNFDVDENGNLWIAGHTRIFDYAAHTRDANVDAPSHIVKVDPKTLERSDVFVSTAGEINAASIGAMHNNTLIVGAVLDGHVMVCPLPE
ncbi:arylesterase [Rhodobiaceae bacterium]|nr:arylesterase [Rhodobiaceae bacterium]